MECRASRSSRRREDRCRSLCRSRMSRLSTRWCQHPLRHVSKSRAAVKRSAAEVLTLISNAPQVELGAVVRIEELRPLDDDGRHIGSNGRSEQCSRRSNRRGELHVEQDVLDWFVDLCNVSLERFTSGGFVPRYAKRRVKRCFEAIRKEASTKVQDVVDNEREKKCCNYKYRAKGFSTQARVVLWWWW